MNFEQRVLNVVEPELDRIIRRFYPSDFDPTDCVKQWEEDNQYERQDDPSGKDILDILMDIWDLLQQAKKEKKTEPKPRKEPTETRPEPEGEIGVLDEFNWENLTPGQRKALDILDDGTALFYDGMGDIRPGTGVPDYLLRAWNEQSTEEKFRLAPESEGGPEGNTVDGRPQTLEDLLEWFDAIESLPPVFEPTIPYNPLIQRWPTPPYLPTPSLPLPAPSATHLEFDPDDVSVEEHLETLLQEFRECCAWMRSHVGSNHCQPEMLVHLMKTRVARRCP